MEGIASSREQANAEIQQLRKERGINDREPHDSVLVSCLDQALNILSDQLSATSTRFLLELVRNADENCYADGIEPRFHLSLYEQDGQKWLRADCNEVGFSFKQLDALTKIGRSTKKSAGIGFKSVFGMADVVYVASGYYEFKLDRNQPIGMIVPALDRFPQKSHRLPDQTQFLVKLQSEDDFKEVYRELQHIRPQLLLFLQKLKELRITFPGGANKLYRCETPEVEHHLEGLEVANMIEEVTDDNNQRPKTTGTTYIFHRHTARQLPPERRRKGVTSSEVVVAFAVKDDFTPLAIPQQAFAFLPVTKSGLRFLVHADFLLETNRESVVPGSSWNKALCSGVRDAVINLIRQVSVLPENAQGHHLRYSWPAYLQRGEGTSDHRFWTAIHQLILTALRDEPILWSQCATAPLQKPRYLKYVPMEYRLQDGTVGLFDYLSINTKHLSFAYTDTSRRHLTLIGVSTLTIAQLCDEFGRWINAVGVSSLEQRSAEWHTKISELFYGRRFLLGRLRKLPIIPVQGGSWVSAEEKHLYLPSNFGVEHITRDVNMSFVCQDAVKDPKRRKFFNYLGLQEYSEVSAGAVGQEVLHSTIDNHKPDEKLEAGVEGKSEEKNKQGDDKTPIPNRTQDTAIPSDFFSDEDTDENSSVPRSNERARGNKPAGDNDQRTSSGAMESADQDNAIPSDFFSDSEGVDGDDGVSTSDEEQLPDTGRDSPTPIRRRLSPPPPQTPTSSIRAKATDGTGILFRSLGSTSSYSNHVKNSSPLYSTLTRPRTPQPQTGLPGRLGGTPTKSTPIITRLQEIGFLGEQFVFSFFQRHIDDWSYSHWTSKFRAGAGYPAFKLEERDFSDFTYLDSSGYMKKLLVDKFSIGEGGAAGIVNTQVEAWVTTTTFHIEVKTTPAHLGQIFGVSQYQVDKMREYDGDPNNAYILIRVYDVESEEPQMKLLPSPWTLFLAGDLDFRARDGYIVRVLQEEQSPGEPDQPPGPKPSELVQIAVVDEARGPAGYDDFDDDGLDAAFSMLGLEDS